MSKVTVTVRVSLPTGGLLEELDEEAIAERIRQRDPSLFAAMLEPDGVLCIGDEEFGDALYYAVPKLCFELVLAALQDAVFEYSFISCNAQARFAIEGDSVVLTSQHFPTTRFARDELVCALFACGRRWLATLEQLGQPADTEWTLPAAAAAEAALKAARLL